MSLSFIFCKDVSCSKFRASLRNVTLSLYANIAINHSTHPIWNKINTAICNSILYKVYRKIKFCCPTINYHKTWMHCIVIVYTFVTLNRSSYNGMWSNLFLVLRAFVIMSRSSHSWIVLHCVVVKVTVLSIVTIE